MKSDYEERKARIMERLAERAEKSKREAERLFEHSRKMASVIPFGQPILVGHHSEKSDRNYRKKIHATMDKAVETKQKADYYESRLESMEANHSISSDDPQALERLKEKLEGLQELQELMKGCNKIVKNKKLTDNQKVEKLIAYNDKITDAYAWKLLTPDYCGRIGFASYRLTNNNANMTRIKERITELEKKESMKTSEVTINNVRILTNMEDNRVQIFFPDKPSEKVRHELKSNGFHWSPQVGAWQRQVTPYAVHRAKQIVTNLCGTADENPNCENCGS